MHHCSKWEELEISQVRSRLGLTFGMVRFAGCCPRFFPVFDGDARSLATLLKHGEVVWFAICFFGFVATYILVLYNAVHDFIHFNDTAKFWIRDRTDGNIVTRWRRAQDGIAIPTSSASFMFWTNFTRHHASPCTVGRSECDRRWISFANLHQNSAVGRLQDFQVASL